MLKQYPENMIDKMITELKSSDAPIFLWGGEQLAGKIKRYLEKEEIKVDGFLINKKYWNSGIKELYSCPVYMLEDYLSEHFCNLIVAFAGYHENLLEERLSSHCKLYALDFIGKFVLEGFDGTITHQFLKENGEKFRWFEELLADDESKKALDSYIFQRMSGVYCKEDYEPDQYFPKEIIRLQEKETFMDCGAYHGESIVDFVGNLEKQNIKEYEMVFSIEAESENVKELKKTSEKYKNVEVVPAGVWNESTRLYMSSGKGDNSQISAEGTESIDVRTIDDILAGREATYIKMDVEGSELKALQGAENTIRKFRPKLAVCVYHKLEDLIEIPEYIYQLCPDYRFYLRNHSPYGIETVLYAV